MNTMNRLLHRHIKNHNLLLLDKIQPNVSTKAGRYENYGVISIYFSLNLTVGYKVVWGLAPSSHNKKGPGLNMNLGLSMRT